MNVANEYIDKLINTFELDDHRYENALRCKTENLFKLGKYDEGEQIMLELIKEKNNSIYPYVQLVDNFEMVGNLEKAKYYYDLGTTKKHFEDFYVLQQREDYFN